MTNHSTLSSSFVLVQDKGYFRPFKVSNCVNCQKRTTLGTVLGGFGIGPHVDWYDGKVVREKHWYLEKDNPRKTVGLKLGCFYSVYMNLLRQAQHAYTEAGDIAESSLAEKGRVALVGVSANDLLSVEAEVCDETSVTEKTASPGITLTPSRLKALDLIDQLPLVPSEEFLDFILTAPPDWHGKWHTIVDAIQPTTWKDFPAKVLASLSLVKH